MEHARHILISTLVALFALGSVVHASTATSMAVDMAVADIQLENTGNCQACPDNDNASPLCDFVCLMSFIALPAPFPIGSMASHATFNDVPDLDFSGRSGTPDPTPPRPSTHN